MTLNSSSRRAAFATLCFLTLGACSSTGGLGEILGSVLGGGGASNQVSGSISAVDTRNSQIGIRQSNGQVVALSYDANTKVIFENQQYAVANLENGDVVTATVQDAGNGKYYTGTIQVTQSVRGSNTGGQNSSTQSFQGTVRQVDRGNGFFTIDDANIGRITVTLPNNLARADIERYNNLRVGDVVRLYGTRQSASQVLLQQFY